MNCHGDANASSVNIINVKSHNFDLKFLVILQVLRKDFLFSIFRWFFVDFLADFSLRFFKPLTKETLFSISVTIFTTSAEKSRPIASFQRQLLWKPSFSCLGDIIRCLFSARESQKDFPMYELISR